MYILLWIFSYETESGSHQNGSHFNSSKFSSHRGIGNRKLNGSHHKPIAKSLQTRVDNVDDCNCQTNAYLSQLERKETYMQASS